MSVLSLLKNQVLSGVIAYNQYKADHVCWIKTILYNALWFGFSGIRKLPILIYNDVNILGKGVIRIEGEMYYGMIRIGIWKAKAHNPTRLMNYGTIVFKGRAIIQGGCIIENYGGIINFGRYNKLAESCKIMCRRSIIIHDYVAVGYETTFMDTDFHYTIDINNGRVLDCDDGVCIGEGTWISSNCKIMKGSKLPKKSIVCSNSLLLHDYSKQLDYTIFAGMPAKPIKQGRMRIFNVLKEQELLSTFRSNNEMTELFLNEYDLQSLCYNNFF